MEMVSFVFLGISIGAFMLLPMMCSIERQRNRFLQRAGKAEAERDRVTEQRDRAWEAIDEALGDLRAVVDESVNEPCGPIEITPTTEGECEERKPGGNVR